MNQDDEPIQEHEDPLEPKPDTALSADSDRSELEEPLASHEEPEPDSDATFLQRWLPHPMLTVMLILLWLALANEFATGGLVMGTILGVLIPKYTSNFWPERPTIRSPQMAVAFLVIVMWDILVANVQVAWIILFRPAAKMRSRWIVIPLDLTSPESIAALSGTITLTPGTVTSDLSADGKSLLVHCLDVADPKAEVDRIKTRYERRLRAIFP